MLPDVSGPHGLRVDDDRPKCSDATRYDAAAACPVLCGPVPHVGIRTLEVRSGVRLGCEGGEGRSGRLDLPRQAVDEEPEEPPADLRKRERCSEPLLRPSVCLCRRDN